MYGYTATLPASSRVPAEEGASGQAREEEAASV